LKHTVKARLTTDGYAEGILRGDRIILGQAITLIESNLSGDRLLASDLIEKIIGYTGNSIRIGITGVPGVGKSTFIEAFGKHITSFGKKVAVLTVDPSSKLSKGSILGDKTRMETLAKNPMVFIRPSAAGNKLGGVAAGTRDAMLLCEAAGYEVIIIETVGVGQSETTVKSMVDFFLLLMLAGAGDELQGIKKGIMEMADAIAITKADGHNLEQAYKAQTEYQHALRLSSVSKSGWEPIVLLSSAITDLGMEKIWNAILEFRNKTEDSGYFSSNRKDQDVTCLHEYFNMLLNSDHERFTNLQQAVKRMEDKVTGKNISPRAAAQKLLEDYHRAIRESTD